MNKLIKLSLYTLLMSISLIYTTQLYSMESVYQYYCEDIIISHTYSYLPSFFSQSPNKAEYIEVLRKDKNKFEQQLKSKLILTKDTLAGVEHPNCSELEPANIFSFKFEDEWHILYPPMNFLVYSYYQKFHDTTDASQFAYNIRQFASNMQSLHLLDKVKKTEINGYSAIGAAILAPDVSIEIKREFIQQLFDLGFKPTKQDIMLAELQLYDSIPTSEKEKMILFLQQEDLVSDVKQNIISCMIESYRVNYWPLPEITSDKK